MKKIRILKQVLVRTHADKLLISFFVFLFIVGFIIFLAEPDIHTYRDALWYCYACVTTIGFGDVIVTTAISKALSVVLSIYAALIIAIVTGVVVNFYNQMIKLRQKETLAAVLDKLEHLPELSKEELEEIAKRAKNFGENLNNN